jgi:hypothetical protein
MHQILLSCCVYIVEDFAAFVRVERRSLRQHAIASGLTQKAANVPALPRIASKTARGSA